jgi:hypothetical protein
MAFIPDMEVKVSMTGQMTNTELRQAIADANGRQNTTTESGRLWYEHMQKLMKIQMARAAAVTVFEDWVDKYKKAGRITTYEPTF